MPRHPQFDVRRRTAAPRRLVLRLVMLDLSNGFFEKLADSIDDAALQESTHTFELPLAEEKQEITGEAALDADSIRSLRSMFLLLDEWDRQLQAGKTDKSSEECEILIDTATQ